MTFEEMERTRQFLLENQAAHDARLASIETKLDKLTDASNTLVETQRGLAETQRGMQEDMRNMFGLIQSSQNEFRQGLQNILTVSEQTMASVRQMTEAIVQTNKRVGTLENRVDALEDSGE